MNRRRIFVAAAVAATVGIVAVLALPRILSRSPVHPAPTSSPSTPQPGDSGLPPRAGWSYFPLTGSDEGFASGATEVNGRLFVWGATGGEPTVWLTDDGVTWKPVKMPPDAISTVRGGRADVIRVAGLRGRIYAWGELGQWEPGFWQPAIWVSEDGSTWAATDFPELHMERATITEIVDTGDSLVAVVTGGVQQLDDITSIPT